MRAEPPGFSLATNASVLSAAPAYTLEVLIGSIPNELIATFPSAVLPQTAPPFVLLKTPLGVPAYTIEETVGSMAKLATTGATTGEGSPSLICFHVSPPSVLLSTPSSPAAT